MIINYTFITNLLNLAKFYLLGKKKKCVYGFPAQDTILI